MSEWQKILKDDAVATLDKLAEKFGHDVIDVEALKPAFENFQIRINAAALDQSKSSRARADEERWVSDVESVRPHGPGARHHRRRHRLARRRRRLTGAEHHAPL